MKQVPATPAERAVIAAAVKHLEPHEIKTADATWTWACYDERLVRAVARLLRERKVKEETPCPR